LAALLPFRIAAKAHREDLFDRSASVAKEHLCTKRDAFISIGLKAPDARDML
jgi:hypothetical protein